GPSRHRGKARSDSASWQTTSTMCSGFASSTAPRLRMLARLTSRSGADLASPSTSGRCLTLKLSTPRTEREHCGLTVGLKEARPSQANTESSVQEEQFAGSGTEASRSE